MIALKFYNPFYCVTKKKILLNLYFIHEKLMKYQMQTPQTKLDFFQMPVIIAQNAISYGFSKMIFLVNGIMNVIHTPNLFYKMSLKNIYAQI